MDDWSSNLHDACVSTQKKFSCPISPKLLTVSESTWNGYLHALKTPVSIVQHTKLDLKVTQNFTTNNMYISRGKRQYGVPTISETRAIKKSLTKGERIRELKRIPPLPTWINHIYF